MPNISDYDKSGYDYTKYWTHREYENEVEKRALSALLPKKGNRILDVGGSFGRLMEIYTKRFRKATILDYSQLALKQAEDNASKLKINNLETVRASAYEMPFPDKSFDTVIMIRVMHHIEDVPKLISELHRVLTPKGTLVLEVANKIHLKARVRAVLKGDLNYTKSEMPIKHATTHVSEEGIFYNYHPSMIERELKAAGLAIKKRRSVSNLRLPKRIKQLIPLPLLLALDTTVTPLFSQLLLGPSIWYVCEKK